MTGKHPEPRAFVRRAPVAVVLAVWAGAGLHGQQAAGQGVEPLALAWRKSPSPAARAALLRFAEAHAVDRQGALALAALAAGDLQNNRGAEALENFRRAQARLPQIGDYLRFGEAKTLIALGRKADAVPLLEAVARASQPQSPQRPWAVLMAGSLLMEAQAPDAVVPLVTRYRKDLPAPQAAYRMGAALEAMGRTGAAALELQKVYYEFPRSEEARKAAPILARIAGAAPPVTAALVLLRSQRLMEGGGMEARRAAEELREAMPGLAGPDRELAQVRVGVARYFARENQAALDHLRALRPSAPEADAERLYYALSAARRLDRYGDVDELLAQLEARHPKSRWRLEALQGAANRFLLANDADGYEPIYQACADSFEPDPQAGQCHWKRAWSHYMRRLPDAPRLLREQAERFPRSEDAPAALYFLGRMAEGSGEPAVAKAYYETVAGRFPNFYYGVVCREQLRRPAIAALAAAAQTLEYLNGLQLPQPGAGADFQSDEATRVRIARARMLAAAAIDDWAEMELRWAARNGAKTNLCALELAAIAERRGEAGQALRFVKAYAPGYLNWRLEDAPQRFWKSAFPLPYRLSLEKHAGANELDPYLVAGLIRQESEFDPEAISRANARGLTQVMPATGRELSRRLGIRGFTTAMLHQPDTNLRIGTFYLRRILDSLEGKWYAALAAYNAGPSRAQRWLGWGQFREASEFVESIPFHETRNYVQTVLRNADIYRRIYGPQATAAARGASAQPVPPAGSAGGDTP